jgi:hypothetical protein
VLALANANSEVAQTCFLGLRLFAEGLEAPGAFAAQMRQKHGFRLNLKLVRRGLARRAEGWKGSSMHEYARASAE